MKISIITVCYNSASTIRDTIESVLAQTYSNIEYIIVDGASKDNTLQIINSYKEKIHEIISESDQGIYDAMNKGIKSATGEVVGFINADDFYASTDVIAQIAQAFMHNPVEAVYGDLCYVRQSDVESVVRYWRSSVFKAGDFKKGWCPPHPTFYVRRSVYLQHGFFELTIAADIEIMMRFLEVHRVSAQYLPITFVKMRLGGESNRSFANIIRQNKEILKALKRHGLQSSFWKFILCKFISRVKQFLIKQAID